MSGKGSTPRPFAVSDDVYSANWALIFGEARDGEQVRKQEVDSGLPGVPDSDRLIDSGTADS